MFPKNHILKHPGEVLLEEFLKPTNSFEPLPSQALGPPIRDAAPSRAWRAFRV